MGDLFFFIRVMVITMVVVVLMQIRWGNTTIESHAMNFLSSSSIVKPVDDVASGAVRFIRNSWSQLTRTLNTNFTNALRSENRPGSRQEILSIDRSKAFVREQAVKTRYAADQMLKQNEPQISEAKNSAANYFQKFKREASSASKKIRGQFIDETVMPGKDNRAAATGDDDELNEE